MTMCIKTLAARMEKLMLRLVRPARAPYALGLLLLGACIDSSLAVDPTSSPATTLGSVIVEPRVAIIAVGATQQLSINAASLTGAPIASFDSILFVLNTPTDSLRAPVSPTGLITARSATTSAMLVN